MTDRLAIAVLAAGAVLSVAAGGRAQSDGRPDARPPGDVLPFRILYGNPGRVLARDTACYIWSEGGRLHVRITSDGRPHEVEGEIRVTEGGVLKDIAIDARGVRIRQPVPHLLQFELQTAEDPEELSVVLAGDIETLRVDLHVDGKQYPSAVRIGERRERPKGLPADLALTGARASWIERFGFN